jgi:hypothetical protein
MKNLFQSFLLFVRESDPKSVAFWMIPIASVLAVWLLTFVATKVLRRRGRMKTAWGINGYLIGSAMAVALILISWLCLGWAQGWFIHSPLTFTLLLSLFVVMQAPWLVLLRMRGHFTQTGLREYLDQPKTVGQLNAAIVLANRKFSRLKYLLALPLVGFVFLLLALSKGQNLISIVYDNSSSMETSSAIDALRKTFETLGDNNEILLTTLEGYDSTNIMEGSTKRSIQEIMAATEPSQLKAGNSTIYNTPADASAGLDLVQSQVWGSPICEGVWKSFLFLQQSREGVPYRKQLLIIITDGDDTFVGNSLEQDFFFSNEEFAARFPSDRVFVIDYSTSGGNAFMNQAQSNGCDVYPASNSVDDYLSALDNALQSFKSNWAIVWWTLIAFALPALICVLIPRKKIA